MTIDDSYELRRNVIFSRHLGLVLNADALAADFPDAYANGERVQEYLRNETQILFGEKSNVAITVFHVGRSSVAVSTLLALGGGIAWVISRAKSLDEGARTIRKWAHQLRSWREQFHRQAQFPYFTVESLKVFCVADLYDRFDIGTSPQIKFIRSDASCTRKPDGTWTAFGPVYLFIPDKRQKITHLYAIGYDGEILYRGQLPPFELETPQLQYENDNEAFVEVCLPDRSRDPDLEEWEKVKAEQDNNIYFEDSEGHLHTERTPR